MGGAGCGGTRSSSSLGSSSFGHPAWVIRLRLICQSVQAPRWRNRMLRPMRAVQQPHPAIRHNRSTGIHRAAGQHGGTGGTDSSSSSGSSSSATSTGLSGQTFGGGGIIGFSPGSPKKSILLYKKKNHFNQWEFVYDPPSRPDDADGQRRRHRPDAKQLHARQ